MKKHIALILLIIAMFAITGCQVAEPGYYTELTTAVNQSVTATSQAAEQILATLKETQALPADKLAKIEATMTSTAEKIAIIQDATIESAKVYDQKSQEDKIGALIDAAIVANSGSAPINPYAGPIGGVLAIIASGYAAMKRSDAVKVGAKYKAHKQGVQAFMTKNEAPELYDEIGKARITNKVT